MVIVENRELIFKGPDLRLKDGGLLNASSLKVHFAFLGTLCRRELVSGFYKVQKQPMDLLGNCPVQEGYAAVVQELGSQRVQIASEV